MTELLAQPYRQSNKEQVNRYYALLTTHPNLLWIAPGLEVADLAAEFRAKYILRTPDAIHAATATHELASGFITNDAVFRRVADFETLLLDSLVERTHT